MLNQNTKLVLVIMMFFLTSVSFSQTVPAIDQSRRVYWGDAGLLPESRNGGLLPETPTVVFNKINVNDYSGSDDQKVQAALVKAKNSPVPAIIFFPEGVYRLYNSIILRYNQGHNDIIFQGEGSDKTTIEFSVGNNNTCFDIRGEFTGSQINLNSNLNKGEKTILCSGLSKGYWIHLCEENFDDGSGDYGHVGQITQIDGYAANGYTIKDEASKTYYKSNTLWVRKINPITNIGIEDLKINRLDGNKGNGNNIRFDYAVNCWIKGVEIYQTCKNHIIITHSSHIEVSGCYINDARDHGGGGYGYGIDLEFSTTNCLIENNIFNKLRHAMIVALGANCNVFGYNYSREQKWDEGWIIDGPDICVHGRYPYANLFEGNVAERIWLDYAHKKNGPYNTFLRNRTISDEYILVLNSTYTNIIGNDNVIEVLNNLGGLAWLLDKLKQIFGSDLYEPSEYTKDLYFNYYPEGPDWDWGWTEIDHGQWYYYRNDAFYFNVMFPRSFLNDISYYYSSRPDFINESSYTWPPNGPSTNLDFDDYIEYTSWRIPAEDRWSLIKKTYISDPTIYYPPTTNGTLTNDETWYGTHLLTGAVTVPSGITLTIIPGTTIKFNGYYSLTIKDGGKILAEGTEASPIVFTSSTGTTPKSWKNIYVYSSHNRFDWCTFQYGDWALKVEGYPNHASDNIIKNCTFHHNDQALRIQKNYNTDVISCNIYDNRHALVCYKNSYDYILGVDFYGNNIYNNDRDGVYSWSSNNLLFFGNVIKNNGLGHSSSCNGIYTRYSDNIDIYEYNTICDNYDVEIKAHYGNPDVECFLSSIHDDSGYELYNYLSNNNPIFADDCWHGEYWPNTSQFYGSVLFYAPLINRPSWDGTTNDGGMGKAIAPVLSGDPEVSDEKKVEQLKAIINTRSVSEEACKALNELFSIIRSDYQNVLGEKELFYGYLEGIYQTNKKNRLGQVALGKMIVWKMLKGDDDSVIVLSNEALKVLSGEERMCVLENLTCLYTYLGQIEKAKTCLEECKEKYSFDQAGIQFIKEELADVKQQIADGIRLKKELEIDPDQTVSSAVPENFDLFCYPNPANPTTTIFFQLPETNHIVLRIINVLGQEIKTLNDEVKEAGSYTVVWDGTNNNGVEVPSGVYLLYLKSGGKVFTKKLTLMK